MELLRQMACAAGARELYYEMWWRYRRDNEPKTEWCDRNKAFFVHIPKTAGTSIYRSLGMELDGFTHASARVLRQLYPDDFPNSYSFAVVRNPWDRMVSIFEYIRNDTDWVEQKRWGERYLKDLSFTEFIEKLESDYLFNVIVMAESFFFPQTYFTHDKDNRQLVTDIFRFENLDEAFEQLKARFSEDIEFVHSRKSKPRKDFREYYTDRTAEIVGRIYDRDVNTYGYSFD